MQTEKIAEELFSILSTMSDTQKHQTSVIDKFTDGLARTTNVIDSMEQHIKTLEKRVETLEKGGREWDKSNKTL